MYNHTDKRKKYEDQQEQIQHFQSQQTFQNSKVQKKELLKQQESISKHQTHQNQYIKQTVEIILRDDKPLVKMKFRQNFKVPYQQEQEQGNNQNSSDNQFESQFNKINLTKDISLSFDQTIPPSKRIKSQIIQENNQEQLQILNTKKIDQPILNLRVVDDKRIIFNTQNSLFCYENFQEKEKKLTEQSFEYEIFGFWIDKAGFLITQTKSSVTIFNKKFQKIDSFLEDQKKDLFTFTLDRSQFKSVVYFSGNQEALLIRNIDYLTNQFQKPQILEIPKIESKPISIEILNQFYLFIGLENGVIYKYKFTLDKIQFYGKYQLNLQGNNQMFFTSILLRYQYCLGIQNNNVFELIYDTNQSKKILKAHQNIVQCFDYYNKENNDFIIHALQSNNTIYEIRKKIKAILEFPQKITCITFEEKTQKFFYGCQDGLICCYSITQD